MVKLDRKTIIKATIFIVFLVGAFFLFRNDAVRSAVTKESIETLVDSFGVFGPVVYILLYAIGTSLLIPGTIFTAVGAILFGPWLGTIYTIIGATIGASAAFWIARTLGHDLAQELFGKRIKKYEKRMVTNGFATIFFLRMVFFPFNVLNFGAGLTQIKFRDYVLGTFFGIIPGTFIITFFVSSISDVFFTHGLFSMEFLIALASVRVLTAIGLFILSFFIPSCVKYVHVKCKEKGWVA